MSGGNAPRQPLRKSAAPPAASAAPLLPEVARLMQQSVHGRMFSAIACLGAKDGRMVHFSALGSPQMPPPARALPPASVFDLGQLTGSLSVSLATAYLVGRNRLDLSMPLVRALPACAGSILADVPLDTLLDHTSGLVGPQDVITPIFEADRRRPGAARILGTSQAAPQIWTELIAQLQRREGPMQSIYNAINTHLLSLAIANIVQKPFATWLVKELFVSLNLEGALHYVLEPRAPRRAKEPYVATGVCPVRQRLLMGEVQDTIAWGIGGAAGHAGLFGSISGVYRVLEALRQGARGQHRMLHAGTLTRLWTKLRRSGASPWTLGWQSMTKHGPLGQGRWHPTSIGHIDAAMGTAYLVDPAGQQTCILLSNRSQAGKMTSTDPGAVTDAATDAWLALCRRIFDALVVAK